MELTRVGGLKGRWIGQLYHSTFSSKARGTAILIHKGIPFKHKSTIADKEGRYIIISGELYSTPLHMVNIYAPNFNNPFSFYLCGFISTYTMCIWTLVSYLGYTCY